jgi:sec-independent protein translocase protein TatA
MPTLGASELVIVLLIIVVIFGSTKLPQLGDGLGRAIKNFKRAVTNPSEIDVTPKKPDAREIPPEPPTAGADADKAAKDKRASNG